MTNNKFEEFSKNQQNIALYAKIFAHPARIAILELLSKVKEIKTGDISLDLPISRTTVSQHLKELKKAGVIRGSISGQKIHYCLNAEQLKKIKQQFDNMFSQIIFEYHCSCEDDVKQLLTKNKTKKNNKKVT